MTVQELIEILRDYPQDATVEIENECGSHVEPTPCIILAGIAYSLSNKIRVAQIAWAARDRSTRAELLNISHICQNFHNLRLRHIIQKLSQNFVQVVY